MLGEPGVRVLVHALYSTAIVVAAALLAAALSSLPAQRAEVWPAPPERAVIIVNPSGAALDARDARRCGPVCDPDVAGVAKLFCRTDRREHRPPISPLTGRVRDDARVRGGRAAVA